MMSNFLAELIGTAILITLGGGVCANVSLAHSKGMGAGWIVISAGWGCAVAVAVYCVDAISGAHLNPAVTIGLACIDRFSWSAVPSYVGAQLLGAFLGSILVWLVYLPHWRLTHDTGAKLGVFCTAPAVRSYLPNVLTETIATAIFVLAVLAVRTPQNLVSGSGLNQALGPFLVGLIVWSIGLSLGGPTGYAINPARDLGPRLAHWALPIAGKGSSDWAYAWVPIVGPLLGGIIGAATYAWLWPAIEN